MKVILKSGTHFYQSLNKNPTLVFTSSKHNQIIFARKYTKPAIMPQNLSFAKAQYIIRFIWSLMPEPFKHDCALYAQALN